MCGAAWFTQLVRRVLVALARVRLCRRWAVHKDAGLVDILVVSATVTLSVQQ